MLRKFYRFKKFEELLGFIGLLYFITLGFVIFFLVHFLVRATIDSLITPPAQKELPVQFDLGLLNEIGGLQNGE